MEDSASKLKLNIKFKIPTATSTPEAGGDGGGTSGSGGDTTQLRPGQPGHRVCDVCGKVFDNGKAWGGHKRHHNKQLKNNNNTTTKRIQDVKSNNIKKQKLVGGGDYDGDGSKVVGGGCSMIKVGDIIMSNDGKPTCRLCGKIFSCMNSIFSHMRLHTESDRDRELNLDSDNQMDLLSSLSGSGWSKTDRRGRGRTPSSEPLSSVTPAPAAAPSTPSQVFSEVPQAAQNLMTLWLDGQRMQTSGSAIKSRVKRETFFNSGEVEADANYDGKLNIDLNLPYVMQESSSDS